MRWHSVAILGAVALAGYFALKPKEEPPEAGGNGVDNVDVFTWDYWSETWGDGSGGGGNVFTDTYNEALDWLSEAWDDVAGE